MLTEPLYRLKLKLLIEEEIIWAQLKMQFFLDCVIHIIRS